MASYKIKFRPAKRPAHPGSVLIQIIHERKVRQLLTPYKIRMDDWNDRNQPTELSEVVEAKRRLNLDIERLAAIERRFIQRGILYTADDLIDEFRRFQRKYSLREFMKETCSDLRQEGRIRTAETYSSTLLSFMKFRKGHDIMLDDFDPTLMNRYQTWLSNRGLRPNTISFYMRILRATYNRALESGEFENRNPFRKVYTGIEKTTKRALPLATISRMARLDLRNEKPVEYARDMFLLSFMLRGMSFIDMALLKKTQLRNGVLTYYRRKTGRRLQIQWTPQMQEIINRYPQNGSEYLLPILSSETTNTRVAYKNKSYKINRSLKQLMPILGLTTPLTLYVARHSWASAAHAKGIPLSIISEGMGHDSETTTQIYLASLDTAAVDRANSLILNAL